MLTNLEHNVNIQREDPVYRPYFTKTRDSFPLQKYHTHTQILHKERHTINAFDNGLYVQNQNWADANTSLENLLAIL